MEIEQLSKRAMEIRTRFAEFERGKFQREWTKEEVMQGFVVDVGDLMKLVMAKSGIRQVEDVDKKLAHELSDCLWCVLVLAKMYGVDIEKSFLATMDELETWIAAKKKELSKSPEPTRTVARAIRKVRLSPNAQGRVARLRNQATKR